MKFTFERCDPTPPHYKFTFDLLELDRYLIIPDIVRIHDTRKEINVYTQARGAGSITVVQRTYRTIRVQNIFNMIKPIGEYWMGNQPAYSDWSHSDYLNFSVPVSNSTAGIISDAYHPLMTPDVFKVLYWLTQGDNWVVIGNYMDVQRTPVGKFGLPALVTTDINLYTDFVYTAEDAPVPTGRTAGFVISMRNDFNNVTNQFPQGGALFSTKLFVTTWASAFQTGLTTNFVADFSYFGAFWEIVKVLN